MQLYMMEGTGVRLKQGDVGQRKEKRIMLLWRKRVVWLGKGHLIPTFLKYLDGQTIG